MTAALVIDDNRATADALSRMLGLLGVSARTAYGPRAALLLIGQAVPDIVFLDLNMPGVDGFEVLAYLRRAPDLASLPVVIVTSDDQPETARRAYALGALEVIPKPVTLEALESVLEKFHHLEE